MEAPPEHRRSSATPTSSSRLPVGEVPRDLSLGLTALGASWARSPARPRVVAAVVQHWDALVEAWAESDLPLVLRRGSEIRGTEVQHSSGRRLVLADNSIAQWAFSRAYAGEVYRLADIRRLLLEDRIPFSYAIRAGDRAQMRFRCSLSVVDNVNQRGWKLCHIEAVGLATRKPVEQIPIADLKRHFRDLVRPSNHFLVPLEWSGFGELPEVIRAIHAFDNGL